MFTMYRPHIYREDLLSANSTDEYVMGLVTYVRDTNRHYRVGRDFAYGEVVFRSEGQSTVTLYANDGTHILHKNLTCHSWLCGGANSIKNSEQNWYYAENGLFEFHRLFSTGEGLDIFNNITSEFEYVLEGEYDFHTLRAGHATMMFRKVFWKHRKTNPLPWWKKLMGVLFR